MSNLANNSASPPKLLLVLTPEGDPSPITVPFDSFLRFSEEVSFGLEDLEDCWKHRAAPMASIAALRRGAMPGQV